MCKDICTFRPRLCRHSAAIREGFGNMKTPHAIDALQICNGSRDLQDPVIGPRRERELHCGIGQQCLTRCIRGRELFEQVAARVDIEWTLIGGTFLVLITGDLPVARLRDAL